MKPVFQLQSLLLLFSMVLLAPPVQSQTAGEVYPGSNFGTIPDGPRFLPGIYGVPRDIRFHVEGRTGSIDTVRVHFSANHVWTGDLRVQLIAPDGRSHLLFARTGATTGKSFGYESNLTDTNQYRFGDDFGPLTGTNWWVAANIGDNDIEQAQLFSTVIAGGAGVEDPAPETSMNDSFRGAQPNGTWILRFEDGYREDIGEVTAAELIITDTGQTHVVTNSLDPVNTAGTLREALTNASPGDLITFSEDLYANGPSSIIVNRPLPTIPDGVAIVGPGSHLLNITRLSGDPFRIFHLPAGRQATIQGLRISRGNEDGGFGGGIYSVGNLHLIDVDLFDNSALSGGGLFSDGRLTMLRSAVRGNEASFSGGGITIFPVGEVRIRHTTIYDNSAEVRGGGIYVDSQPNNLEIELSNSTIAANSAPLGPGILQAGSGNSSVRLTSNLFADQSPNLLQIGGHTWVSKGFNLADDDGGNNLALILSDQPDTDPGELSLDIDSGLTPVLRLPVDSPALDAGIATDASFFDGRGEGFRRTEELERPNAHRSDGTDIGAFELRGPFLFKSRFESGQRR